MAVTDQSLSVSTVSSPSSLPSTSLPGPLTPLLQDTHFLDVQPYVDISSEPVPPVSIINQLIQDEASKIVGGLRKYYKMLPDVLDVEEGEVLRRGSMLGMELQRVEMGARAEELDSSRYTLQVLGEVKGEKIAAAGDWIGACREVAVVGETVTRTAEQVEMASRFAPVGWRIANSELELMLEQMKRVRKRTELETEALHARRKSEQVKTGHLLQSLEKNYWSLVQANEEINRACNRIERERATLSSIRKSEG